MADPAGIIGIIGVVGQVIQWSVQTGLDWKDAPAEARGFVSELQTLKTVLSEANTNVLTNPDFADAFHGRHSALLSELDSLHDTPTQAMLYTCKRELEKLLEDLKRRAQGHKLGWERLKGAFLASSTLEAVEKLSRRCATLNSMLQIDLVALAASTHREVNEGRKEQQQQHQTQYRVLNHVRQRVDDQKSREEEEAALNWLSPDDYHTTQHNDFSRGRQPGTGEWLLKSDEFEAWVSGKTPTLFCPGMPGAGKTVMASMVVDHLHSTFSGHLGVGIAFLYCNFRRQSDQTPEKLLSDLLKQLASGIRPCLETIKALHQRHIAKRTRPPLSELAQTLRSALGFYDEKVFVVVDALDECSNEDSNWTKLLTVLFKAQTASESRVALLATSRPIPDIISQFQGAPLLEIRASREDIERYLRGRIGDLKSFVARRPDLQDEVVSGITEAVDGMFLLAQLYINSLVDKSTPRSLRDAVNRFQARGAERGDARRLELLSQAYDGAMGRINGQMPGDQDLAIQVLSWVTCAKRPLKAAELQHAIATEPGDEELDHQNLPEVEDLISVCAGLVTFDQDGSIIRLVHYTTQEYFERSQGRWLPDADLTIAETCLTYLSFRTFESGFCPTDEEVDARLEFNPLYDYAAHHWGQHARDSACGTEQLHRFFNRHAQVEAAGQMLLRTYDYKLWDLFLWGVPQHIRGPHLAAYFDLHEYLSLDTLPDPDILDSHRRSPLHYAALKGNTAAAKVLLDTGRVDINRRDLSRRTPLALAAYTGHLGIVKLLLATGNAELDGRGGDPPLNLALRHKRTDVIQLLLAASEIDINERGSDGWTPLATAVIVEDEALLKMLLATGRVDVNLVDRLGRTPLMIAARGKTGGRVAVIQALLTTEGIDVNARDRDGFTALATASAEGHQDVVEVILTAPHLDINLQNHDERATPLQWAIRHGRTQIMKVLLATGRVDLERRDATGSTALLTATKLQNWEAVHLLLATGQVDVDKADRMGHTPLSYAARYGKLEVVQALLVTGQVDVNAVSKDGVSPLKYARDNGHTATAKLLLANGAHDI